MEINELQKICKTVRRDIITSVTAAKSGHPGGSLSAVEILVALYFQEMKVDPGPIGKRDTASSSPRDMQLPHSTRSLRNGGTLIPQS